MAPDRGREPFELKHSHQSAIGSRIAGMRALLDDLERNGVPHESLAPIEEELDALERKTGARIPRRGNIVQAAAGRLYVIACELRSSVIGGYGKLGAREAALLDRHAESLARRALELAGQLEAASPGRGSSTPDSGVPTTPGRGGRR
jgi:hypothetical protein